MKLKSRGLGRRELIMDFREYEISREGDEIVIVGTIHEPVTWDFSIRIAEDDIPGLLRVGVNHNTLRLGARWIFHRHPKGHTEVAETAADRAVARREERAARALASVDDTDVLDDEDVEAAPRAATG